MVRPSKISGRPRPIRREVYFSEGEFNQLQEAARAVDLPIAVYLRKIALAQQIRPAKSRAAQELITVLHKLTAELNKVGSNLNQLAHQANAAGYDPAKIGLDPTLNGIQDVAARLVETIKKV